jgi:hypothetical protein
VISASPVRSGAHNPLHQDVNLATANRDPRTVPSLPSSLRYADVVLIVVAAPILLLMGVSAAGYAIGAGAWIVLRAVGTAMESVASSSTQPQREISLRLAYLLGRLFLLALAVIVARNGDGRDAGITALAIIVFAFTIELALSAATRPRRA